MQFSDSLRARWLALPIATALVVAACAGPGATPGTTPGGTPGPGDSPGVGSPGPGDSPGPVEGGTVSVIGTWGGDEQEAFLAMVAPFEESTGIDVQYTGTRDINAVLTTGVQSGILPDVAGLPGPGQMREWAQQGALHDLRDVLDYDTYVEQTSPGFVDLGTVDDMLAGVFIKSAVKGLIWYNPNHYTGDVPADFAALEEAAANPAPAEAGWCIGLESGAASGWPATDWIENILIRQSGPEVYDAWLEGRHAWTSEEVRQAFETYGRAVENAFGGSTYILATNFFPAAQPMFDDPPGCLFHHQASFITGADGFGGYPSQPVAEEDYDFFVMPDINPDYQGALVGAGDLFGMFNDTPQARELMKWLVTPEAQQIWVDRGGAISGNILVTEYPDPIAQKTAEALAESTVFRFDASDLMPEAMNNAFWSAMLEYTENPDNLDAILQNLDEVQADAYAPAE